MLKSISAKDLNMLLFRNIGGWTKVCNQLYASLGNKYNLTVQFLQPQQVQIERQKI